MNWHGTWVSHGIKIYSKIVFDFGINWPIEQANSVNSSVPHMIYLANLNDFGEHHL